MTIYSYDGSVIKAGAKPYRLLNHSFLFGDDLSEGVDVERLESARTRATIEAGGLNAIANIEPDKSNGADWAFTGGPRNGATQKCRRIVVEILTRLRDMFPEMQLGIYAMTPIRNRNEVVKWHASARRGRYQDLLPQLMAWRDQTLENIEWLEPFVDFWCPSLYDAIGGDSAWTQYAMAQIQQLDPYTDLEIRPFISNISEGKLLPTSVTRADRFFHGAGVKSLWHAQVDFVRMAMDEDVIQGVYLWGNQGWEKHVEILREGLIEPTKKEVTL